MSRKGRGKSENVSFFGKNQENLYVREVSMLVYGDSKWFENNNYEEVCAFLRSAAGKIRQESERNDEILVFFMLHRQNRKFLSRAAGSLSGRGTL